MSDGSSMGAEQHAAQLRLKVRCRFGGSLAALRLTHVQLATSFNYLSQRCPQDMAAIADRLAEILSSKRHGAPKSSVTGPALGPSKESRNHRRRNVEVEME